MNHDTEMDSEPVVSAINVWKCGWCNTTGNEKTIFYTPLVPDRWGEYYFCKGKKCVEYYDNYIYRRDLSQGLPNSEAEEPITKAGQCVFCGYIGLNVIMNCKRIFCKNETCFSNFLDFHRAYPMREKLVAEIPFCFKREIMLAISKCISDVPEGV